ncbi:hypothetical protein J2848_006295 [Azospirillum lipoferum]|nr:MULTISPECIES: hypothetical protein [Azospirillum]MCP1614590.1 hypothetical protein [Azospirillum lipoferum]MDW5532579.1 hypothetical protein [Azospirillum sp. NL1]
MIDLSAWDSIAQRGLATEPAYRRIPEPPLNALEPLFAVCRLPSAA